MTKEQGIASNILECIIEIRKHTDNIMKNNASTGIIKKYVSNNLNEVPEEVLEKVGKDVMNLMAIYDFTNCIYDELEKLVSTDELEVLEDDLND